MNATISVLIADDQPLFRRAIGGLLAAESDIEVVGEASDGEEATRLATQLAPDVVLLDLRMPKMDGLEATAKIREAAPTARIIILTVSDADEDLVEAIKAGASGYLLKDIDPAEVPQSIRSVAAGNAMVSPAMAAKLLNEFTAAVKGAEAKGHRPQLTDREVEVLRAVVDGGTNRQIAKQLEIAENTVKNHIRNILEKLHLASRTEAAVWAMREGLLDDGDNPPKS